MITAVNGFLLGSFKVNPVASVPIKQGMKNNERSANDYKEDADSFVKTFEKASRIKEAENQPHDCYTVTYNASSQLQTFFFHQSKSYN